MASTSEHDALAANFASDPRIYFNKVTGRWQFEDDDGKEMEYDTATGTWVQVVRLLDRIPLHGHESDTFTPTTHCRSMKIF